MNDAPTAAAAVSHDSMANAIRFLSADAISKAASGHPGMPMGMADVATVLFTRFLKYDAAQPRWADRDRFILSAGHGSMLLYSLMYLTGYADMTLEQIMNEPMIAYPNTRAMCSANSDGAAAAVIVSGEKLRTLSAEQQRRAVKISASVLTSDPYEEGCQILPNVNTLTRMAATQAYELAGIGPEDLDLVELHDCFATAELVHYDNLMLCPEGGAVDFFNSGATWRDGSTPVNVSGGLESKGHPIAATGIANIWEICHHLRGEAGARQIEGAKVGLAHVIGLGSACGVHILEKSGL
jgi:acetyl-CoA acetyltransferase